MKSILLTLLCFLALPVAVAAQTIYCYVHSETCPDDFPPDADVVVEGESITLRGTDILETDAHWYYADRSSGAWSALDNVEVQAFAMGSFEDLFDQVGWKDYLKDTDTAFQISADHSLILALHDNTLHLMDTQSSFVLSIDFVEDVYVPTCTTPDGDRIYWARNIREDFPLIRCLRRFHFGSRRAKLRIVENPDLFRAGALEVVNSTSPFDFEKQRYSIEHHLNPPEIWFNEMGKYGAMFQLYIKLDGTYSEDLKYGKFGAQRLRSISLHERLVYLDIESMKYGDLSGVDQRKRFARSALLNFMEPAMSSPAKWLLWVETGDDNILIRNLSTLFTVEEKT